MITLWVLILIVQVIGFGCLVFVAVMASDRIEAAMRDARLNGAFSQAMKHSLLRPGQAPDRTGLEDVARARALAMAASGAPPPPPLRPQDLPPERK